MPPKHPNEKEMLNRYNRGESATKIAKSLGLYTTSVTRALKRQGAICGYKKGKNHPMWKGGKLNKYGYIKIWNPNHHRANNIGYVSEHILIMEKKLKRKISKDEHIHHIDFSRGNNDANNLWVCSDRNHKIAERSIQKLVKTLLQKNLIKFNREKGIYELIE